MPSGPQVPLFEIKDKQDIQAAARVLAEAFENDEYMLWTFGSREKYRKYSQPVFESWVWYGVLYAHVYRTQSYECVAMLKEPGHFDFSIWGMLWSGMLFTNIWYLGFSGCLRLSQYEQAASAQAQQLPSTQNFWYLWQIGVGNESQGQGMGAKVVDAIESSILEQTNGEEATIYLEAVSAGSSRFFSRKGYKNLGSYDLEYSANGKSTAIQCMEKTIGPANGSL